MNKPHKHAEVIKAWADGAQIEWRNPGTVHQVDREFWKPLKSDYPMWSNTFEYRVKLKEYPKSTLDYNALCDIYSKSTNHPNRNGEGIVTFALSMAVDEAIKHFIESGEMAAYFLNPDNGFVREEGV